MRTRTRSIVTAFVLLSLVSGAIGCRSNGGPWYNPKSYAWHNPFKSSEAPPYGAEGTAQANTKPSMDAQPNVNTPPGGYTNKEDEARFLAGKKDGPVLVPQYGMPDSMDSTRVASANTMPAQQSVYPDTSVYSPYGGNDPALNASVQAGGYQPTNLHSSAVPQSQPGMYPGTGIQGMPAADPMTYPGTTAAPSTTGGYSPYGAPVQDAAPIYGEPAMANPAYAQPTAGFGAQQTAPEMGVPQGYGAQTPAAPQGYGVPSTPQGYGAQPSSAPQGYGAPIGMTAPVDPNAMGYTAAPSVYPSSSHTGF